MELTLQLITVGSVTMGGMFPARAQKDHVLFIQDRVHTKSLSTAVLPYVKVKYWYCVLASRVRRPRSELPDASVSETHWTLP